MTDREFAEELRALMAKYKRLMAASRGELEVKRFFRKAHTVRAYRVGGHWVRRIGKVA